MLALYHLTIYFVYQKIIKEENLYVNTQLYKDLEQDNK